jgi:hypothetical protein
MGSLQSFNWKWWAVLHWWMPIADTVKFVADGARARGRSEIGVGGRGRGEQGESVLLLALACVCVCVVCRVAGASIILIIYGLFTFSIPLKVKRCVQDTIFMMV